VAGGRAWSPPAAQIAAETGARLTVTEDVDEGVKGVDFLHTDVWVSMGERRKSGTNASSCSSPTRSTWTVVSDRQPQRQVHALLPAFHNRETKVGEEIYEKSGMDGLEVTEEVFESPLLDRLRPGGEPHAHHQGDHGGDAGRLTATRQVGASWRNGERGQRRSSCHSASLSPCSCNPRTDLIGYQLTC
jgi:hypothetical protein